MSAEDTPVWEKQNLLTKQQVPNHKLRLEICPLATQLEQPGLLSFVCCLSGKSGVLSFCGPVSNLRLHNSIIWNEQELHDNNSVT